VLAQAPAGLSCFLVERGPGMEFQRLKDKLGGRSLPSAEVEFAAATARLIGEEGRGINAIITMVNHTRLDCILGAVSSHRRGVVQAIHHARHRSAFGALLVDQPVMRNVLADLALDSEAATVTAMRVARSYDEPSEADFRRLATAVMKCWLTKRAPAHAAEALECLGGNGFVEDSGMPSLYRGSVLGSIWEGSGNVAALDVLRAIACQPQALSAFIEEFELARGGDRRLDAHLDRLGQAVPELAGDGSEASRPAAEFGARRLVQQLALAFAGSLLVRHSPPAIADAFCAARFAGDGGRVYGTLPAGIDAAAIIERALPA
jgi:putative acyl-CoA dehydrogenase